MRISVEYNAIRYNEDIKTVLRKFSQFAQQELFIVSKPTNIESIYEDFNFIDNYNIKLYENKIDKLDIINEINASTHFDNDIEVVNALSKIEGVLLKSFSKENICINQVI